VAEVVTTLRVKVLRLLVRRGVIEEPDEQLVLLPDELAESEPAPRACRDTTRPFGRRCIDASVVAPRSNTPVFSLVAPCWRRASTTSLLDDSCRDRP